MTIDESNGDRAQHPATPAYDALVERDRIAVDLLAAHTLAQDNDLKGCLPAIRAFKEAIASTEMGVEIARVGEVEKHAKVKDIMQTRDGLRKQKKEWPRESNGDIRKAEYEFTQAALPLNDTLQAAQDAALEQAYVAAREAHMRLEAKRKKPASGRSESSHPSRGYGLK